MPGVGVSLYSNREGLGPTPGQNPDSEGLRLRFHTPANKGHLPAKHSVRMQSVQHTCNVTCAGDGRDLRHCINLLTGWPFQSNSLTSGEGRRNVTTGSPYTALHGYMRAIIEILIL